MTGHARRRSIATPSQPEATHAPTIDPGPRSPDGSRESGWLLSSRLYACSTQVMVYRAGVIARSDPGLGLLELDTSTAQIHSEDTCVTDGSHHRELPLDDEALYWLRSDDGDGLLLRGPDTSWSLFRPFEREPAG